MDSLAAGCVGGRESPSSKRRRIKPKIEQDYPQLNHSVDSGSSRPSSASFTPRIENVVTMVLCHSTCCQGNKMKKLTSIFFVVVVSFINATVEMRTGGGGSGSSNSAATQRVSGSRSCSSSRSCGRCSRRGRVSTRFATNRSSPRHLGSSRTQIPIGTPRNRIPITVRRSQQHEHDPNCRRNWISSYSIYHCCRCNATTTTNATRR